eukprot:2363645-Amphidinium_carterae.1
MVCVEWWVMEVIVLFSGRMHNSVAAVGFGDKSSELGHPPSPDWGVILVIKPDMRYDVQKLSI